jgi:amidase
MRMPTLVEKEHHILAMTRDAEPAVRVPAGSRVHLETADCFGDQVHGMADADRGLDWERVNPATGPVYVEGALPGDVLAVSVVRIEIADRGIMCTGGGWGVLGDRIARLHWRFLDIADGHAVWDDRLTIPLRPMIGVLGVAPADGPVPCGTPGHHGGNLDTRLVAEGATVYLPVATEGALLAAGDLHAAMGDGEVAVTGIEVSGRVALDVDVRRDLRLGDPLLEDSVRVATIASALTLDEAAESATRVMAELLSGRLGLSLPDAVMLMSAVGSLEVSQIVDPLRTARFVMRKESFEPTYGQLV